MSTLPAEPVGKQMSAQFRLDFDWVKSHYADLVPQYAGQWVVVHKGKVVASGTNIARIETQAKDEHGTHEMPVVYVEDGINIY